MRAGAASPDGTQVPLAVSLAHGRPVPLGRLERGLPVPGASLSVSRFATMDLAPNPGAELLACPAEDRTEALWLLYRRTPPALRARLVEQVLAQSERSELDLSGLWIARRRGRIVGAVLTQRLAGEAAAIWPPEVGLTWSRSTLASALVRAAVDDLRSRGARLAQALLEVGAPRLAGLDLQAGGVPRITELHYLRRDVAQPIDAPAAHRLHWTPYSDRADADFRAVLETTYLDSLDMPELDGARSLDDIMVSHRAAGRFVPDHWRLGRLAGEPDAAGLVLLAEHPHRSAWEVAYLGLSPAARGRGLGRAALAHALRLAQGHAYWIELAVDVRNIPARRLYEATGFQRFDRRVVHLARLD